MDNLRLIIHNRDGDRYLSPATLNGISLSYTRRGTAGKVQFSVLYDEKLTIEEGDEVLIYNGEQKLFYGFVFVIKMTAEKSFTVTAYDQVRYLINKDVYSFVGVKASEIIQRIADDFQVKVGEIIDTEFIIPKMKVNNDTLLDVIEKALDHTIIATKEMYTLYDDFGKLMLKRPSDMQVPILIDAETAQTIDYTRSIDKDTYNKIKLFTDNKDEGTRQIWIEQDSANIKRWGVLQLSESVNKNQPSNLVDMAQKKLELHNVVKRSLSISGAFGDFRVRGGSLLYVSLSIGNETFQQPVIVEGVSHTVKNNEHLMNLRVIGGSINNAS